MQTNQAIRKTISVAAIAMSLLLAFQIDLQLACASAAGDGNPAPIDLSQATDEEILSVSRYFSDEHIARILWPEYSPAVSPRLRTMLSERDERGLTPKQVGDLTRWVGQYKGPETNALLMGLAGALMKTEITSEEYWTLVACQSGLGYEGATAEGLEELTKRTTKTYWDGQDVRPACPECESGERTADEVRDKLRIHAFHSLYLSGTKYALETLQNGEGFPEDLLEPVVLEEAIEFVEACMRGERPEIYEEP